MGSRIVPICSFYVSVFVYFSWNTPGIEKKPGDAIQRKRSLRIQYKPGCRLGQYFNEKTHRLGIERWRQPALANRLAVENGTIYRDRISILEG
jgi:hypothetical protein